ncbi:Tetratricopeptide repeat-containing protein [Burkholderia sp. GAS332]|uniref:NfrA family protein n=1 Tax=Paraburkholderia sediminicola TaxID=458836 RepID=UPI00092CD0FF|nr:Tetratricopeptide repeat-containing protein [Burkholderia sp. GAS332]
MKHHAACALYLALVFAGSPVHADEIVPLPLSGSAYRVAQQAYSAFDQRRYAESAAQAREAIRQRPDLVSLRLLLANALAATGDGRGARSTLDVAIRELGPDRALTARRNQLAVAAKAPRSGRGTGRRAPPSAVVGKAAVPGTAAPSADTSPPLTGAAFEAGDRAYRAYARNDYASAVAAAQEALALRPDVLTLRLLVIDALTAQGDDQGAYAADLDAVKRSGDNESLRLRRVFIGGRLAPGPAAASYKALESGDLDTAVDQARLAIRYAPDVLAYHEQLIAALLRANRLSDADQAATDTIAVDDSEIVPWVLRGYIRERLGEHAQSLADFGRALQIRDAVQQDQRNSRIIIADVALATGEPQRALDALQDLKPIGDASDLMIAVRRRNAKRALAATPNAVPATVSASAGAPPAPILDCAITQYGTLCSLNPYDPAFAVHQAGARAYDKRDYAVALERAREAVRIAPDDPVHRMFLINALSAAGQPAEAKRESAALVDAGLLDSLPDLNAAYLAAGAGKPKLAAYHFSVADQAHELPPASLLDAGYASLGAGMTDAATGYFKRSLDADTAKEITLKPQQRFETRRADSELERVWGVNASLGYRAPGGQTNLALNPSASADENLQGGAEAYWRPFGYQGGRLIELYARLYDTFYSRAGDVTGMPSLQGALGVRAKPFATQNVIFAFERVIALGSQVQPDWLARIAYSNGFGNDLRVDVPSWWTGQVYGEAGHFITHSQNYWTFNGELGRSYRLDRLSPNAVIFPYAVIGGDYNAQINNSSAFGAGVGVNLRYWFREDTYHAPRSFVDLSLQYRLKIAGDDRARGVFFNANFNY